MEKENKIIINSEYGKVIQKSMFKEEEFFMKRLTSQIHRFILHDKDNELRYPDYQRDYVWSLEDKRDLIESIFDGIEIGRIVLHEEFDTNKSSDTWCFEVIDGKQRLGTILEYYKDKFSVRNKLYSELSERDQRKFSNILIPVIEVKNLSRKDQLNLFIKVNTTGKVMSEEHLNKVKEEYKNLSGDLK